MNLFLGMASGNTNISSAAFNQFFQGQGPFSGANLGANGADNLLSQLEKFRSTMSNPLSNLQLPPQMQALMGNLNGPMNILQQVINQGGQTADTQDIRDKFNTIFNGQTGNQAALSALANNILGNGGLTGGMGSALEGAQSLLANGGFTGATQNLSNVGGNMVSQRGYGPETQGAMDFFSNIMQNGGRDSGTQNLVNAGQGLLNSGGMTPQMNQLMSYVTNGFGSGGSTPQLEDLISGGKNLVAQGGMTGPMTGFLQQIYSQLAQGGMTNEARQVFDKAMGIVNNNGQGGALLPMDTVVNMARNEAATGAANQAEAARRSAQQRNGSAVFSGNSENNFNEFSDQMLRNQGSAVQKASTDQQTLQLQQLLGALGVSGDLTKAATGLVGNLYGAGSDLFKTAGSNLASGANMQIAGNEGIAKNLASYAGLGGDLSRSAASNIGTGAGLMSSGEQLAAQRMGQGISGFQDTIANTLNRLKLGSDMVTGSQASANQRLLGGISGMNDTTGQQFSNLFNAGNILNNQTNQSLQATQGLQGLTGLEFNNGQDAMKSLAGLLGIGNSMYTGQQQMALSSNAQQMDALLQSLGISSNISNNFTNQWMGAANGMTNIGQLYSSLIPSTMSQYGDLSQLLAKFQSQPGFWSQFGGNLLNGLVGGLTGGLGSLATSGLKGLFGGGSTARGNMNVSGGSDARN